MHVPNSWCLFQFLHLSHIQALLALMDEAYTGSAIADSQGDAASSGPGSARDETEALFSDLLKDENEGLAVCHNSSPKCGHMFEGY